MSKSDRADESYLLLSSAGTDLDRLAQKSDRTLLVEIGGGGDVARMWLSTQLMARGLPPVSEFFATIRLTKPSRTILPLFFGQADACIVSESALAVMIELNPQINRKIKLLDRSPKFVNLLVCGTKNISDVNTQRLHEEIEILSNTSDGQQALTIIQMKRFFEFDPEYLRATEALFNRHRQLMKAKK